MRLQSATHTQGFSLVELLVVIAILGTLVGLSTGVIQLARESANNVQCQNNLNQIGRALAQHHDAYGVLPHNGGWDGKQQIKAIDGTLFTPSTFDKGLHRNFQWGVGQPGLSPASQLGPWCYAILPYLDQQSAYQNRDWPQPLTTYICPSRRTALSYEVVSADDYGTYRGGGWKWGKIDYGSNEFLMGTPPKCYRLNQITDGASNTLMVGEKAFNPTVQTAGTWYFDEPYFLGGSAGTARPGLEVQPDGPGQAFKQNWGSAHTSTANFLFADGSVHSFAFGTPWDIMAPLLSPNDGDVPRQGEGGL